MMRKKTAFVCLSVLLAAVSIGSLGAETQSPAPGKTVVVYFSQTGNTRTACETVAQEFSADMVELKVTKPPAAKGQLPEIDPKRIDLNPYSSVIVASPVWAANLVPAVRAFLRDNSLGGRKSIILITTNTAMPEQFQEKHKKLVADAGGNVVGYYQLVMMEQKDGKPAPRKAVDIQKDTKSIASEILKGLSK
jgi:flavodoxin